MKKNLIIALLVLAIVFVTGCVSEVQDSLEKEVSADEAEALLGSTRPLVGEASAFLLEGQEQCITLRSTSCKDIEAGVIAQKGVKTYTLKDTCSVDEQRQFTCNKDGSVSLCRTSCSAGCGDDNQCALPGPSCIDSDLSEAHSLEEGGVVHSPGEDRFIAGYTIDNNGVRVDDYCIVGHPELPDYTYVMEAICIDGVKPSMAMPYECEFGCIEGECISENSPTFLCQTHSANRGFRYDSAYDSDNDCIMSYPDPRLADYQKDCNDLDPNITFECYE